MKASLFDREIFRTADRPAGIWRIAVRSWPSLTALVCWAIAIGLGFYLLARYEMSPGVAAAPPLAWPVDSGLDRAADRATLVIAVHPRCPCSRATMNELEQVMIRYQGLVHANVLFMRPGDFPVGWEKTNLWEIGESIPGVTVFSDEDGTEARRFGSVTSGQTLLYDSDGRLLFSGGLTGSRGQVGENAGRAAVESLLTEGRSEQATSNVFGCPLFDDNSECPQSERLKGSRNGTGKNLTTR